MYSTPIWGPYCGYRGAQRGLRDLGVFPARSSRERLEEGRGGSRSGSKPNRMNGDVFKSVEGIDVIEKSRSVDGICGSIRHSV